jgi:RNA polymerase sigma factor (TIGR02999 family)
MADITQLLEAATAGDPAAAAQLLPLVYDELRKLAAAWMSAETPGQTLQPTALVHEAYLRLVGGPKRPDWSGRGHFFAAAAQAMRRILIDVARRKQAEVHGGDRGRVDLDRAEVVSDLPPERLLALDEALDRLSLHDPVAGRLVQLKYFAGLSVEQAADVLGLSRANAYRHWTFARSWLVCQLAGGPDPAAG